VGCILLCCLFVYDIFWVFYSADLFGKNVMLSVAEKTTSNPVARVAEALNISSVSISAHIELPSKMIIPTLDGRGWGMLGLGDIAVPGILLSFLYRQTFPRAAFYYWLGMSGYAAGLVVTLLVSLAWNQAQPALLFLVPGTLVPLVVVSLWRGDFRVLWDTVEVVSVEPAGEKHV